MQYRGMKNIGICINRCLDGAGETCTNRYLDELKASGDEICAIKLWLACVANWLHT